MTNTFELKVLAPNRTWPTVKATSAILPGTLGYMTILPDHAAMIAELQAGEVVVDVQGAPAERYFVTGGYVEVDRNKVSVLADVIENAKDISLPKAEQALAEAQAALSVLTPETDVEEANRRLRAAEARLQVAKGSR